jgi:hypothetical protein
MLHVRFASRVRSYASIVTTGLVTTALGSALLPAQESVAVPANDTVLVFARDTSLLTGKDTVLHGAPETGGARRGSEVLIPFGSMLLPGLGQYMQGATRAGLGYTATAVAGHMLGEQAGEYEGDFPRRARDQFLSSAEDVGITASMLSAWDSFHRAVPAMQGQGRYDFLTRQESVGDLMTAPFDMSFLRRWTTWVDLGQTLLITAIVLNEGTGSFWYNAAVISATLAVEERPGTTMHLGFPTVRF